MRLPKFIFLLSIFFLIFGVTDAQEPKKPDKPSDNKLQTQPNHKGKKHHKRINKLKLEFTNSCDTEIVNGDANALYETLYDYRNKTKRFPELKTVLKDYFEKYVKIRNMMISCIESNETKAEMLFELGKAYKTIIHNKKMARKLILQAIELTKNVNLINKMKYELGYRNPNQTFDDDEDSYKSRAVSTKNIYMNIMPPEINSEVAGGLRVNIYTDKKKYKLGRQILIYTVIRNKTDKVIEFTTDYSATNGTTFFYYWYKHEKGSDTDRYCRFPPQQITNSITKNSVICYENDFGIHFNKIGKYKMTFSIYVNNKKGKEVIVESNELEIMIVE